jgi:hypothetical protein
MPYIVREELELFFGNDVAEEIYTTVQNKYPNHNCEDIIKANIEFAKRNIPENSDDDGEILIAFIRKAIENDLSGTTAIQSSAKTTAEKTIIDSLIEIFVDEQRASKIYNNVKTKYPNTNCDEFIKVNVEFAKQKEKKLKTAFPEYLEYAILKNLAGYC